MIKQKLKSTVDTIKAGGELLFKNFLRIVLYTFALFVLISLGDRSFYKFMPSDFFIKYDNAQVANALEGEDVPFTVCRDARGSYDFKGFREIRMIPAGKTEKEAVTVKVTPVSNFVDNSSRCKNYFISKTDYYHTPGKYFIQANLKIEVKYREIKDASFKSNVYTIFEKKSLTLEEKYDEQQRAINSLQQQLNELRAAAGIQPAVISTNDSQVAQNNNPEPVDRTVKPDTSKPQPEANPQDRGFLGNVIDSVGKLLDNLL